jgi:hypothetical protein
MPGPGQSWTGSPHRAAAVIAFRPYRNRVMTKSRGRLARHAIQIVAAYTADAAW